MNFKLTLTRALTGNRVRSNSRFSLTITPSMVPNSLRRFQSLNLLHLRRPQVLLQVRANRALRLRHLPRALRLLHQLPRALRLLRQLPRRALRLLRRLPRRALRLLRRLPRALRLRLHVPVLDRVLFRVPHCSHRLLLHHHRLRSKSRGPEETKPQHSSTVPRHCGTR